MRIPTRHLATVLLAIVLVSNATAADPPLRYRLEPGRIFGYSATLEVQQAGRTEYHVGFPLFAVSATAKGQATAVLAFRLQQVKSAETIPSLPAEFHTEKISLRGGDYSLNEERRSFQYLPGSIVDQIFTPLPDESSERQWGDRDSFVVFGNTDRGHQESRYELLDSSGRFRETFVRHIQSESGIAKEEWRGGGEVQFDLQRGLITRRDFALAYSKPPGDARSQIQVKLTLRLLDESELRQAARATAVRLPGEPPSAAESKLMHAVAGSGRSAHADTKFYDTQKLLAVQEDGLYRSLVVGELQRGQLCYRLEGSRAFWDGNLPPEKFQFIPGEINPNGGNVATVDAAQRQQLLADLQGGDLDRASKAIKQLANLRPVEPDDEMAAAMITWLGVTDGNMASFFSEAMQHWATLRIAEELIKEMSLPDPIARRICCAGLTGIGAPAENVIAGYLQHHNPEVRERLLSILGQIGTPQSLPVLAGIEQQSTDKKISRAANFAAVQIRQRHGLKGPAALELEDSRAEFERERARHRAEFDRKVKQNNDDFNRRVQEQRRKAEEQRRKHEAEMKARRRAAR